MTKEKNLEIMTEEELDKVAGGTDSEYWELAELLPRVKTWYGTEKFMNEKEMAEWMDKNLNINATIFCNLNDVRKNIYSRLIELSGGSFTTKSFTHEEVVKMVKEKLGK